MNMTAGSTGINKSTNLKSKPEQCSEWANKAGFGSPKQFDLKPYHYGIVMTKEEMK